MLPERENIAIAELAVYLLSILLSLYVSHRHGFLRQLGWLYLVIFSGLRIAGAAITILSVHHPTSRTDATWGSILGSIGLSPLLLAALGLLERLNQFLQGKKPTLLAIRILHIPAILALILAIIGGERLSSSSPSKQSSGQTFEKGSGILFLVVYLALCALTFLTLSSIRSLPSPEKRILLAVLAALPLLAVRLIYSLLADFKNDSTFNIYEGNATVQLCMAVIEEMVVVAFFLAAGMTVPPYKSVKPNGGQIAMTAKDGPLYEQQV